MVYKWKMPGLFDVPAQTAGEELERIYNKHGRVDKADVLEESRAEDAPLHPCFEWDDQKAAELYRLNQAGGIVRALVTVENERPQLDNVRAFAHVEHTYQPMTVVLQSRENTDELLQNALREAEAFQRRNRMLSELQPIFAAIDVVRRRERKKARNEQRC